MRTKKKTKKKHKPVWFIRVVDSPMVAHPNICGAGVVTHIAFENALLAN